MLEPELEALFNVSEEFFTKQYHTLIKIPEYLRYFHNSVFGAMHSYLLTLVNRVEEKKMPARFRMNDNYVRRLGKFYEEGYLAAYCTDEQLEKATLYNKRTIQKARALLEKLKLVKVVHGKEKGSFYYLVGERLKTLNYDGFSTGDRHEGLYLQSWLYRAKEDLDKFRDFLKLHFCSHLKDTGKTPIKKTALDFKPIEEIKEVRLPITLVAANMGLPQPKKRSGRTPTVKAPDESYTPLLEPEDATPVEESKSVPEETQPLYTSTLRNIIHESAKYISPEKTEDESPEPAPSAEKPVTDYAPIVDIPILDTSLKMLDLQTPQFDRPPKTAKELLYEQMTKANNPVGSIKYMRSLLTDKYMEESSVREVLYKLWNVKKKFHVEGFPRLSAVSTFYEGTTDANKKIKNTRRLSDIYFAMREDIAKRTATGLTSAEYTKVMALCTDLLTKYPYEQIVWTITTACRDSISDARFTAQHPANLSQLVGSKSELYNSYKAERYHLAMEKERVNRLSEEETARRERRAEEEALTGGIVDVTKMSETGRRIYEEYLLHKSDKNEGE